MGNLLQYPGAIWLCSCYELGHQPLGIAWPMSFLERAGYHPSGIDLAVEELNTAKIAQARFVGISVPMHTALRLGVRAAQRIRAQNPSSHICFYGLYASLNADYLLEHVADTVMGGEYESALLALVQSIDAGDTSEIKGAGQRPRAGAPYRLRQSFPVPSRRHLPVLAKYAHLEIEGARRTVGYVEASRGCLHQCRHCPIPPIYEGRFFVVPQEIVLEDIRRLVQAEATHITFGDPDFLNGPGHSRRIVRALHAEYPHLTFDFTAKIEHILKYRSLFPEMAEQGALFMVSAVESLSDTVLQQLDKRHTRSDVGEALQIVKQSGIALRPTWVPFTPWTTAADYLEMLDFIEAQELIYHVDPVQYTIRLLIPPGSLLLSQPSLLSFLGALDAEAFSYSWKHPDPRMDNLQSLVRQAVERAVRRREDPMETFYGVRALAYEVLGIAERWSRRAPHRTHPRPPRLSESWFC